MHVPPVFHLPEDGDLQSTSCNHCHCHICLQNSNRLSLIYLYIVCDSMCMHTIAHVYSPSTYLFQKHARDANTAVLATLGAEAFNPVLQNDAAIAPACCSPWRFDEELSSRMAVQVCSEYVSLIPSKMTCLGLLKDITREFLSIPNNPMR